jgi:glycine cleavage system regulatory protein
VPESSKNTVLVVTFSGVDRGGIVKTLAAVVSNYGANWEESRMARLAGRFAGILKLSVPPSEAEHLAEALTALAWDGLVVVVEPGGLPPLKPKQCATLEITGTDREGIIRDVSRALVACSANIEQFNTDYESAPMSGGLLFKVTAVVCFHKDFEIERLTQALEKIADDLMVDVGLPYKP